MENADIGIVVQELISATLAAGAPDNVTVLDCGSVRRQRVSDTPSFLLWTFGRDG